MTGILESLSTLAINLVENLGYLGVMLGTAFFPSEITMPWQELPFLRER